MSNTNTRRSPLREWASVTEIPDAGSPAYGMWVARHLILARALREQLPWISLAAPFFHAIERLRKAERDMTDPDRADNISHYVRLLDLAYAIKRAQELIDDPQAFGGAP